MPRYVDKWIFQNITKIVETHARNWQKSGLYTSFPHKDLHVDPTQSVNDQLITPH